METAYPNPSKILPLEFKINRQAYLRFNITVDELAPTTTGWTWQLFIKRFPGDRKNIVSLTLGNGLSYEVYSDTTLVAHFTSAQLNIEEAEYYWELVRTDIENTWIEGPANFTFSNKQSDEVQSAEFDVNVDSSGTPVTIEVTAFSSATSSNFLVKSLNLSDVANAATARTNLGASTVGGNLFSLTNPSAVTWPRLNADNTVSALSANNTLNALLPSQGGNSGKFLTTDGTNTSWATVDVSGKWDFSTASTQTWTANQTYAGSSANRLNIGFSTLGANSGLSVLSTATDLNHTPGTNSLGFFSTSGANGTAGKTSIALSGISANTGTTSTGIGVYGKSSGATTNYAFYGETDTNIQHYIGRTGAFTEVGKLFIGDLGGEIGTQDPTFNSFIQRVTGTLHVANNVVVTSGTAVLEKGPGNGNLIELGQAGTQFWATPTGSSAGTALTRRMVIHPNGYVGVNLPAGSVPAYSFDLTGRGALIGANTSSTDNLRTNATDKVFKLGSVHRTSSTEEPVLLIQSSNDATNNGILIGGGTSTHNAATYIKFYTAADTTTVTGTERMNIGSGGLISIGAVTATALLHLADSTTSRASLRIAEGVAPTSPNDGDIWKETTNDRLMFRMGTASKEIISSDSVNAVSPTSPNRTITIVHNGTTYYIHAKTTND